MVAASDVVQCGPGVFERGREPVRQQPVGQDEGVDAEAGQPARVAFAFVRWKFPEAAAGQDEDGGSGAEEPVLGGVKRDLL